MKHKLNGFTLVELMIVTVLLGILIGITAFGVGNWRERTARNEVKSDLIGGASALNNNHNFTSTYPSAQAEFEDLFRSSPGVELTYTHRADGSYCLSGHSVARPFIRYKVDSNSSNAEPSEGGCT